SDVDHLFRLQVLARPDHGRPASVLRHSVPHSLASTVTRRPHHYEGQDMNQDQMILKRRYWARRGLVLGEFVLFSAVATVGLAGAPGSGQSWAGVPTAP